eukprot:TRINITY_DN27366_c0_g1_i19.p1 TRINITY_DN27366_c0_g1~~TRINITY_DN27366_c0_g1_i19.p1  ORF type:complete len:629 (+),score=110.84 TRINITY_DN27366_c0_g1_i19:322-2208(+)
MRFDPSPGMYTVQITGIPKRLPDPNLLRHHLSEVYPEQVVSAHVVRDMGELFDLQQDLHDVKYKIAACQSELEMEGMPPRHCVCCCSHTGCCGLVDSIAELTAEQESLVTKIQAESQRVKEGGVRCSGRGFVTMRTIEQAGQMVTDFGPSGARKESPHSAALHIHSWEVERAPEPGDIIWSNAAVSKSERTFRVFSLNFCFFWITTLFLTPVAFSNGASEFTNSNLGSFGQLFVDYIPSLVLVLYVWIVMPLMLNVLSKLEKHWLRSDAKNSFLVKYFVYLFLAAVVCPVLSTSIGALVESLATGSSTISESLNHVLVNQAGQRYMIYVINFAFFSTPFQLLNLDIAATRAFKWLAAETHVISTADSPANTQNFEFELNYAITMHIFCICIFFSVFSPIILCFGIVFFIVKHCVDRYNLVHFFDRSPQSGGRLASTANHLMINSVGLLLIAMLGFFVSKKKYGCSGALLAVTITLTVLYGIITICRSTKHGGVTRNVLPPTLRHVLDQTAGGVSYMSDKLEEGMTETLSLLMPVQFLPGFQGVASLETPALQQMKVNPENFRYTYRNPAYTLYLEHTGLEADVGPSSEQPGPGESVGWVGERGSGEDSEPVGEMQTVDAQNNPWFSNQ